MHWVLRLCNAALVLLYSKLLNASVDNNATGSNCVLDGASER